MTNQSLKYRPDLQGLRAIAIFLVVAAHAGTPFIQGGFIGVDVFFVLSGYLITGILVQELHKTSNINIGFFYARRLKRLLPALAFMLTMSFCMAAWLLSPVEFQAQASSSPFAITWTSNIYFAFQVIDYFDELSVRDLFLHTWSLSVEEQFYLIWPLILLSVHWLGKFGNKKGKDQFHYIFPALTVFFFGSFLLSLYWMTNAPLSAFYLMPSRIWQFSLGAIILLCSQQSLFEERRSFKINIPAKLVTTIGLTLITAFSFILGPEHTYPGFWAIAPSFGAALIIIGGQKVITEGGQTALTHPTLIWLGDRSYSLYLWHWPIFILGASLGLLSQPFGSLALVLLTLLVSELSFRFIELPFWKGRFSHARPRFVILTGLLVVLASFLFMYQKLQGHSKIEAENYISHNWRSDVPEIYKNGCDAWYSHSRVEPCVYGNDSAKHTAIFLGDSIGAQWFSMYKAFFAEPDWQLVILTKSSCPIIDEDFYYIRLGKVFEICKEWRDASLELIETIKPDVLIIGSAATYNFDESQWVEGSSRIFERMGQIATATVVIPGTPALGFDGPECVSRHMLADGRVNLEACEADDRLKLVQQSIGYLNNAASRFSNVYFLDLNHLICPDGICNAVTEDGVIIFRDSQHLTNTFVKSQLPVISGKWHQLFK